MISVDSSVWIDYFNGALSRRCGITVRKSIETFIATLGIESGYDLLHEGRDFEPFVQHLGFALTCGRQFCFRPPFGRLDRLESRSAAKIDRPTKPGTSPQ